MYLLERTAVTSNSDKKKYLRDASVARCVGYIGSKLGGGETALAAEPSLRGYKSTPVTDPEC